MLRDLNPVLQTIVGHLRETTASFAVVGGLAISVRTKPRFTNDVDLAVTADNDSQAERVLRFLIHRRYRLIQELDNRVTGRLATARLLPPGSASEEVDPVLDLLFASSGIEPEAVAAATDAEVLPHITVPTAQVSHLIAMKVLAASSQRKVDYADLDALIQRATPDGLMEVRSLLKLITQRGYNRDENLQAKFDAHLKTLK